jgi:tRNA threonylcarbamoyladenosine biosynthesis protein TsaB
MANILALDTATDACSVTVLHDGEVRSRCELIPRQHSQRIFGMLQEVAPEGPAALALDVLAYAQGPGSFTGLRIAASAIQGIAYSCGLPVAQFSTLACMAQGAWRKQLVPESLPVLVLLDARINEIYWGLYTLENGCACALRPDAVCAPAQLLDCGLDTIGECAVVGNGLGYRAELQAYLDNYARVEVLEHWPHSEDLLPLAERALALGEVVSAERVQPVYVREEISWKKLSEQG